MLAPPADPAKPRTACACCGAAFACNPGGACWCAAEPVRLPMPQTDETCLCRDCLRAEAAAAGANPPA
jgi:hypothetical protein